MKTLAVLAIAAAGFIGFGSPAEAAPSCPPKTASLFGGPCVSPKALPKGSQARKAARLAIRVCPPGSAEFGFAIFTPPPESGVDPFVVWVTNCR